MSSATINLSVDNILSFNGHGGKYSGKSFTLDPKDNVYILVPFGLGVEGVKSSGNSTKKTDNTFKGLDVCYGFPSPENISGKTQSFEDIIYSKAGKLKLTFGLNVDAKWYLYKPGDDVPNVNYYPWKTGDPAAAAATCKEVSTKYDPFVSDLMKNCLASSDELNKKVCALFVSDSTKTTKYDAGKTTSEVLTDNKGNHHLKLKICGDDPNVATTTLEELASNCHNLVQFSRDYVLKNVSGTYAGYKDENIFPKSGKDDSIILLPFSCNSCGPTDDIALSHTNAGNASVKSLSDIIADLAGGGGGGGSGDPPSGKVAQFFMTFDDGINGGLNSDKQAQKIVNFVNCLMGKKYKHIGLTYSANQDQTEQIFSDYEYNKDSSDNKFADGEEKNISSQILNGTNQANVLTQLNTKITSDASYSEFRKAFRVIPFTTMRYEKQGTPPKEVGVDLDTSAPGNNTECIGAAKAFLQLPDSIILGWCNQGCGDMNDAGNAKQKFAIGSGVAKSLDNANKLYIPQYLQFLEKEWNEEVQKIVNICNPNHASVDAGASSTSLPSKVAPSKPLDDIIKDLIAGIKNTEDTEATLLALSIKEPPGGLVYKYTSSDASPPPSSSSASPPSSISTPPPPPATEDKNLNSAQPTIEDMVTAFKAADGGETNFYLGACGSIKAAYDLEMSGISASDASAEQAKMRAKLLLNLRKNSLLLKVPRRWNYAEMKLGKEPEPVMEPPFSVPLQNETGVFCFENVGFQLLFSIDSVRQMAKQTEEQIKEIIKDCSSITDTNYKIYCQDAFLNTYHVLNLMEQQYKRDKTKAPDAKEYKSNLEQIKNNLLKDKSGQADAAEFLTRVLLLYLKIDKSIYDSIKFEKYNLKLCNTDVNNENMESVFFGKYSTDITNNPEILKTIGIDINNKKLIDITSIADDDFYLTCSVNANSNLQTCIDTSLGEVKYEKTNEKSLNADIEMEKQLVGASKCITDNIKNQPVLYIPDKQKYLIVVLGRFNDNATMNNDNVSVSEKITINEDGQYGKKVEFKLRGVICKTGSAGGGHYVYISYENDKKILYNDHLAPADFTNQYEMNKQGYVFLYEKITTSQSGGSNNIPRSITYTNAAITNHTASKSKHNSSFKVSSSSKSKGKSRNRSHTQRVK